MGPFDLNHEGSLPGTLGGVTGAWENFDAVFEQTAKVDSSFGIETEVRRRWEQTVVDYERATGQAFQRNGVTQELTGTGEVTQLIEPWLPPGSTGAGKSFFAGDFGNLSSRTMRESVERVRQIDQAIKLANDPRYRSMDAILQEVLQEREQIRGTAADVSERAGVLGTLAGFAGGMAGSFTSADPFNVLTLGVGGFGRSAVMRIASEMGIGAATEGVNQLAFVRPTQEALGETTTPLAEQLAYAVVGSGAFQAGAEGLGKLAQRFLSRAPTEPASDLFNLDDAQLRGMFENAAASPRARAAVMLLDEDDWVRANNPFGDSPAGMKRFTGELDEAARRLNGEPMTAIERVPGQRVSFDLDELDLDLQIVRAERPAVWARYEEAKARVEELDGTIDELARKVDDVKLSAAVARIDEDSGRLIEGYEEALLKPGLTRKEQIDIARKVDQIVQSLGEANVERALADAGIDPKFELRSTRATRKAAKAEFREAQNAVNAELARVKAAQRVKELRLNSEAAKAVALTRAGRGSEDLAATHPEVVSAHVDTVTTLSPKVDDDDFWDQLLKESGLFELPQVTGSKVMIGDMEFDLDTVVPDMNDPGKSVTLGKALEDIQEDARLVEAMRTCAI